MLGLEIKGEIAQSVSAITASRQLPVQRWPLTPVGRNREFVRRRFLSSSRTSHGLPVFAQMGVLDAKHNSRSRNKTPSSVLPFHPSRTSYEKNCANPLARQQTRSRLPRRSDDRLSHATRARHTHVALKVCHAGRDNSGRRGGSR